MSEGYIHTCPGDPTIRATALPPTWRCAGCNADVPYGSTHQCGAPVTTTVPVEIDLVAKLPPLSREQVVCCTPEERAFAQWQVEVGQWGDSTFPNHHIGRTPASGPLYHLAKEVRELVEAYEAGVSIEGELADVGILSFQVAHRSGLSLYAVMQAKMAENRNRQWGQPDEHGIVEHLREAGE